MPSQWIPLHLLYFALLFLYVTGRPRYKGPGRYAQRIIYVLEKLPVDEQDRLAAMARSGKVIEAIKELRDNAPTDLATAKATVEGLAVFRPPP